MLEKKEFKIDIVNLLFRVKSMNNLKPKRFLDEISNFVPLLLLTFIESS